MTPTQRARLGALVRNALACEAAMQSRCICPCGGIFHGKKHSVEFWMEEGSKIVPDDEERMQAWAAATATLADQLKLLM